jgi:hypothetical protein
MSASSGSTRNIVLTANGQNAGAIVRLRISNPSVAYTATYNVYNASTSGTLLFNFSIDAYTYASQLQFVYNGTSFMILTSEIPASGNTA